MNIDILLGVFRATGGAEIGDKKYGRRKGFQIRRTG
jgi:hypothetical protein